MNQLQFTKYYLEDLEYTADPTHDRVSKVRHIKPWKEIENYSKTNNFDLLDTIDLDSKDYNVYCWSDTHFFHKNVIKYTNRPFADQFEMNDYMVTQYNNIVSDNDIVIFGGDVSFKGDSETNLLLDQLKGTKIQIVGNHDINRDGKLKKLNFDYTLLFLIINYNHQKLYFTHYPLDKVPSNGINCHGHIHQHNPPTKDHRNISVEHTEFKPILLKSII